jgi:hypothetical protein
MNNQKTKTVNSSNFNNNFYVNPYSESNVSVKLNDCTNDDDDNKVESINLLNTNKKNDDISPLDVKFLDENVSCNIDNKNDDDDNNQCVDFRHKVKSILRSHKFHLVLVILVNLFFLVYYLICIFIEYILIKKVIIESLFVACEVSLLIYSCF